MKPHVRPLARTIHGEVPQRNGREDVGDVIEVAELFGRELGHSVYTDALEAQTTRSRVTRVQASSSTCVASMLFTV